MIEQRLKALGLELPEAMPPVYQYEPVVIHQGVAYVSGQLPKVGQDVRHKGKVGAEVTMDQAKDDARLCILHALACLSQALGGDLGRIERILKVTGFVASAKGFNDQPKVLDAASELLGELLGEAGRHARSAVGVAELPRDTPVEIELVVAVKA